MAVILSQSFSDLNVVGNNTYTDGFKLTRPLSGAYPTVADEIAARLAAYTANKAGFTNESDTLLAQRRAKLYGTLK
jgi:hypothetical protein